MLDEVMKNVGNHVGWSLIAVKLFIQHFSWDWRHFYVGFNVGCICAIMLDENVWRFCANDLSCNFSNFSMWLFVQHFVQQRIWNVGLNVGFICAGLKICRWKQKWRLWTTYIDRGNTGNYKRAMNGSCNRFWIISRCVICLILPLICRKFYVIKNREISRLISGIHLLKKIFIYKTFGNSLIILTFGNKNSMKG